jgi:hypothetical protein
LQFHGFPAGLPFVAGFHFGFDLFTFDSIEDLDPISGGD